MKHICYTSSCSSATSSPFLHCWAAKPEEFAWTQKGRSVLLFLFTAGLLRRTGHLCALVRLPVTLPGTQFACPPSRGGLGGVAACKHGRHKARFRPYQTILQAPLAVQSLCRCWFHGLTCVNRCFMAVAIFQSLRAWSFLENSSHTWSCSREAPGYTSGLCSVALCCFTDLVGIQRCSLHRVRDRCSSAASAGKTLRLGWTRWRLACVWCRCGTPWTVAQLARVELVGAVSVECVFPPLELQIMFWTHHL